MPTLSPVNYFANLIQAVSGSNGMHDLQYAGTPDAAATFTRGSLVSLNVAGDLIAGCVDATATVAPMPMFAINGVNDLDVSSETGNISGGAVGTFVATGGYELFTTEFVTGNYVPNTLLDAAIGADAGKVKARALAATSTAVGVVSRNYVSATPTKSQGGVAILHFWPVFIPKAI